MKYCKIKIKKKELEVQLAKDWRDLRPGDVIKVITGSGPYYLSKDNPGEKIMMGHMKIFLYEMKVRF